MKIVQTLFEKERTLVFSHIFLIKIQHLLYLAT